MPTQQAPATTTELRKNFAPSIRLGRLYLVVATGRYKFYDGQDQSLSEAFVNGSTLDDATSTRPIIIESSGRVRL